MFRGRCSCAISDRTGPASTPQIPVSLLFPVDTTIPPVTPFFLLDTKMVGVGGLPGSSTANSRLPTTNCASPLTPIIPTLTVHSPVSPIIPHTYAKPRGRGCTPPNAPADQKQSRHTKLLLSLYLLKEFRRADILDHRHGQRWLANRQSQITTHEMNRQLTTGSYYCGYCLIPVTRSPVKCTNTVLSGGWP